MTLLTLVCLDKFVRPHYQINEGLNEDEFTLMYSSMKELVDEFINFIDVFINEPVQCPLQISRHNICSLLKETYEKITRERTLE